MSTLPPALQAGDTIALISPSLRLNDLFPARVSSAQSFLESLGFKVKLIEENFAAYIFPERREAVCEEIHEAFSDQSVKCIMCTIGGSSCNELLSALDYDLIRENPKIFIGYSDITVLHHALATQCNLRTFYGPTALGQFAESPKPLPFTVENFLHVLVSKAGRALGAVPRSKEFTQDSLDWDAEAPPTRSTSASPAWKWLHPGTARGRLTGGCVPALLHLKGTKYFPDLRNAILVLEFPPDSGNAEAPYSLELARSNMVDLLNIGALDSLAGVVLGRPYKYDEATTVQFEKMIVEVCATAAEAAAAGQGKKAIAKAAQLFPILTNVDLGHTDPMLTLPFGCLATLDSEKDEFKLAGLATMAPAKDPVVDLAEDYGESLTLKNAGEK